MESAVRTEPVLSVLITVSYRYWDRIHTESSFSAVWESAKMHAFQKTVPVRARVRPTPYAGHARAQIPMNDSENTQLALAMFPGHLRAALAYIFLLGRSSPDSDYVRGMPAAEKERILKIARDNMAIIEQEARLLGSAVLDSAPYAFLLRSFARAQSAFSAS
tara:strand:+ start:249 stop:734 length:486 start_codon:yes stop_codon:yes gene_type:complete